MKKMVILMFICLSLVGCGYSKGKSITCEHPDGRSYYVSEEAGLSNSEYNDIKRKYENNGYKCYN